MKKAKPRSPLLYLIGQIASKSFYGLLNAIIFLLRLVFALPFWLLSTSKRIYHQQNFWLMKSRLWLIRRCLLRPSKPSTPSVKKADYLETDFSDAFDGAKLKEDIHTVAMNIMKANSTPVDLPQVRKYVIGVNGGWGSGKTFASRELAGYIDRRWENVHVKYTQLLPFNDINEFLSNLLSTIAVELYRAGLLDVRSEFRRLLIDATPKNNFNFKFSMFGLEVGTNLNLKGDYHSDLKKKFEYFARVDAREGYEGGHKLLIVIDDLDRMKSDEMVVIIRMIENFKDVPGVIFILPFYREVVSSSIGEYLSLEDADAHMYLRKFIDYSLTISLTLDHLRHSFNKGLALRQHQIQSVDRTFFYGENLETAFWYIFLYICLTEEYAKHSPKTTFQSDYMRRLTTLLGGSSAENLYLQRGKNLKTKAEQKWQRLADIPGVQEGSEYNWSCLNTAEVLLDYVVCQQNQVGDDKKQKTFLEEIVFKNMAQSSQEAFLANNYSRRDMQQIASRIMAEYWLLNDAQKQDLKLVVNIIKEQFAQWR